MFLLNANGAELASSTSRSNVAVASRASRRCLAACLESDVRGSLRTDHRTQGSSLCYLGIENRFTLVLALDISSRYKYNSGPLSASVSQVGESEERGGEGRFYLN